MRYLALIAHGSRRRESNDEVRALAMALEERAGSELGGVRCGFLELAEPSIPDAIAECVAGGASEVLVLPYFLSAGRHVVEDIPREVEVARSRCPGVAIRLLDYPGADGAMPDLLLGAVRRAGSGP